VLLPRHAISNWYSEDEDTDVDGGDGDSGADAVVVCTTEGSTYSLQSSLLPVITEAALVWILTAASPLQY